ncbi:MAG TPA: hypothetical protein VJ867_16610 [Gemmatimonadaceae bacterium]|nr:hypothetical protein [Gemmatimonadaceae bacterium]
MARARAPVSAPVRAIARAFAAASCAIVLTAHVGSPDVFFTGTAGPYAIRVTIRPPDVVPGIARVTVYAPHSVQHVSIRPVFWRAGSRGAPSADDMQRTVANGEARFDGSIWLMARGAYSVDVRVEGAAGSALVSVPVASIATGRLALSPALAALLVALGIVLVAGLVNIVYKGAGESLVEPGGTMEASRIRRARRIAAVSVPILGVAVLGGARWWGAVDRDYERTVYRPSALRLARTSDTLRVAASDTLWLPNRPARYVADHGKLMHLFLIRQDGRAFAHLHPVVTDSATIPAFLTLVPPLPAGSYRVFADVVHENGFARTLIGDLALSAPAHTGTATDPDDAWFVGDAPHDGNARLADGSLMHLDVSPGARVQSGQEMSFRVTVSDPSGKPAQLEPYLGMAGHAVVERDDGSVYVHLHPMGTVSAAAQGVLLARDRGDTTADGGLRAVDAVAMSHVPSDVIAIPYAFPRGGSYRVFVQVKRNGRVLTGAFALVVADAPSAAR